MTEVPSRSVAPRIDDEPCETVLEQDIVNVLDAVSRPKLQPMARNVQLIQVYEEQGLVLIRLLGEQAGCGASDTVIEAMVEDDLRKNISAVKRVTAVE